MYESYYELKGKPFALSPDARFFYPSRAHKRAMSYLDYGVQSGEGFIVVTGDVGTGKTTLVQGLLDSLRNKPITAANVVSTQLEGLDLLQTVAGAFGVSYVGLSKARLLSNLGEFLHQAAAAGRRTLLIIDEAQNLSKSALEELRMLSNLQQGAKPLLQSFLVGQPEFKEILRSSDMLQLQQRVIAAYHLGPLDESDTRAYIEHRLRVVGWQGRPSIDDGAFAEIFVQTGGVPRRINVFCDRLFLMGFLEERAVLTRDAALLVAEDMTSEFGLSAAAAAPTLVKEVPEQVLHDDLASRQLDVLDALQRLVTQGLRLERYVLAGFRAVKELSERIESHAISLPPEALRAHPEEGDENVGFRNSENRPERSAAGD